MFWIYIKKEILDNYFKHLPGIEITLVNIHIVDHKIKLVLKGIDTLEIIFDEKEIGNCQLSKSKFKSLFTRDRKILFFTKRKR